MALKKLEHASDIVILLIPRSGRFVGGQRWLLLDGLSSRSELDLVLVLGRIALARY